MQTLMMETTTSPLVLRASSELMKNQIAGAVLAAHPGMRAVRDASGHAMLLWIEAGTLYAAMRSPTSKTGWRRCPLTLGLGGSVTAFDVGQLSDDRLIIAAVVAPATSKSSRQLRVTSILSNDPMADRWDDMDGAWFPREDLADGQIIESIRIGASSSRGLPIAVAAVRDTNGVEQYLVNIDARHTKSSWTKFDLPNNAVGRVELAAGMVGGDVGVFALYDTSHDRSASSSLVFTTLPDEESGRSERYDFELTTRATCLAVTSSTSEINSDVYVGGEALQVFPASTTDNPITLSRPGALPAIYELAVTQDATSTSVFAIAGDQILVHGEGARDRFAEWSAPRQLAKDVSSIAIMRGAGATELFMAKAKAMTCLYQEPGQKLWKPIDIQFPSADHLASFISYTARVEVLDAAKRRCVSQALELRADSVTHLFVNGELHIAGPMHAVPVITDATGAITVVIPVDDLAVTTLRLRAAGGPDVEIRPSRKLEADLAKLDDLASLATREVSQQTLDSVREATRGIMTASEKTTGRHALLRASHDDTVHVLSFSGGETRLSVHGGRLLGAAGDSWVPDWLNAAFVEAGNALAWMSEKIDEAAHFAWRLAGEMVEVLVQIGTEIIKFAFRALEAGLRTVSWVLEKALGIDLSGLWKALGFVFDWTEIDQLRDNISRDVLALIDLAESKIDDIAKRADDILLHFESYLPVPDPTFVPASLDALRGHADAATDDHPAIDGAASSPATNWGLGQLLHGDVFSFDVGSLLPAGEDVVETAQLLVSLWEGLGDKRTVLIADIESLFSGPMDLRSAFLKLGSDALFAFVEGLREIVATGCAGAHHLVAGFRTLVTTPLPIPFFRAFLERDVSILDVVALVTAVPASVTHRIIMRRPLFEPRHLLRAEAATNPLRWRDWIYPLASVVYDAMNVVGSVFAEKIPEGGQVIYDAIRFVVNATRLGCGHPAEDGSPQYEFQLQAWHTYGGALFCDMGCWFILFGGYMSTKDPAKRKGMRRVAGGLRGTAILGSCIAAMYFEGKTSNIDFEVFSKPGHKRSDAIAKLWQNVGYFVADLSAGALNIAGPEASPELIEYAGPINAVAAGVAVAINVGRLIGNEANATPHANY